MISQTKKRQQRTNTPTSLAISMAMRIRQYNAERITHNSKSRATLDAIRRRHWASICPVLPRRMSWSSILAQKNNLWHCETAVLMLAFKRHETYPLLSLSKQQAA